MSTSVHRRLLIRPGAIGDCILAFPQMEALRTDFTEVWSPRPVLPLVRFADHKRAIIDTGLDLVGVLPAGQLREILRTLESFDSIYSWYGSARQEFRDAVAHLPFTFFPALPPAATGVPRIPVPAALRRRLAIVHPFASSAKKTWPIEDFISLAQALEGEGMPVTWTWGPEEKLPEALRPRSVHLTDLYELGRWIATACVYVGNDSGISHLAAAVGTPTVAIFQSTDPGIWAPRGPHVRALWRPDVKQVCATVLELAQTRQAVRPTAV